MLASKSNSTTRLHFILAAVLVILILALLYGINRPSRLDIFHQETHKTQESQTAVPGATPSSDVRKGVVPSPLSFYTHPFSSSLDPAKRAYATTLYSESYLPGALLLGYSLRKHGMLNPDVAQHMVLLHIGGRLSDEILQLLQSVGWQTIAVDKIPAPKGKPPAKGYRDQYTKLRLFELEKFDQIFYIDADALVVKPFPEIWSFPVPFAASRDVRANAVGIWLPTINAGTFLAKPNRRLLENMLEVAPLLDYDSWFAEQALLDKYWLRDLTFYPYIYNGQLDMKRGLPEVWDAFLPDMRIIHYTGTKPWWCGYSVNEPEERRLWIRDWEEMVAMREMDGDPLPGDLPHLTAHGFCVNSTVGTQ
ncbi:hypothetical protein FRC20_004067 [Serendipita sp. 405]|nr:hypothetical protein FRC20_004067 [Serendipita sp. 405]